MFFVIMGKKSFASLVHTFIFKIEGFNLILEMSLHSKQRLFYKMFKPH